MILPIVAYGHPVLRAATRELQPGYPGLEALITNMWETMYQKGIGLGLAAPQVNHALRLLVLDTQQIIARMSEEERKESGWENDPGLKAVVINPRILSVSEEDSVDEEGCLSLPRVRVEVTRPLEIRIAYQDEQFQSFETTFVGLTARALLHEIDHLEGKLIVDYLSPLKKKLMQRKLQDIMKGKVDAEYRMMFADRI
ncbi:MAG: peptide deformylase [Bacteroidetes bacterium]|nr:peptide deformylase [Bacteroidota bacterium]